MKYEEIVSILKGMRPAGMRPVFSEVMREWLRAVGQEAESYCGKTLKPVKRRLRPALLHAVPKRGRQVPIDIPW